MADGGSRGNMADVAFDAGRNVFNKVNTQVKQTTQSASQQVTGSGQYATTDANTNPQNEDRQLDPLQKAQQQNQHTNSAGQAGAQSPQQKQANGKTPEEQQKLAENRKALQALFMESYGNQFSINGSPKKKEPTVQERLEQEQQQKEQKEVMELEKKEKEKPIKPPQTAERRAGMGVGG